ncbi:MAG: 1-acyl-sn-glycerol-3-phosphate acyltransferase [Chloroflexi bacterium]|nr:1-acyl-sn-glycerol-3-phosphate acyltransferase [Chloroflexota bacterium]
MNEHLTVEQYIAMQPSFAWKRRLLRAFFRWLCFTFMWKVTVSGTENVPDAGPTMLIMNHISSIDPFLAIGALDKRFVIPMTKIENLNNPFLAPFIRAWGAYSIRRGEVDRKALLNSIELIKSGQLVLIAPEGTRTPTGLTQPKDGMTYVATKANAVIVPMGVSAGAIDWKEKLKKLQRAAIHIHFGRPFRFKTDGRPRIPRDEMAKMTDEAMYQLALALPNPELRGIYSDLNKATTQYIELL